MAFGTKAMKKIAKKLTVMQTCKLTVDLQKKKPKWKRTMVLLL